MFLMYMHSVSALPPGHTVGHKTTQFSPRTEASHGAAQAPVKFAAGDFGQGFAEGFRILRNLVIGAFVLGVGGALGVGYWIGHKNTDTQPAAVQKTEDQPVSDKERIKQLEQRLKELESKQKAH
jgi:hypothetical protein